MVGKIVQYNLLKCKRRRIHATCAMKNAGKNIIHISHHASDDGPTTSLLIRGARRCVEWERDDHDHHMITMHAQACA